MIHIIILLISLLLSFSFGACPCSNKDLCNPIQTKDRPELFAFQLLDAQWKTYNWDQITTVAMFGSYDPELMCTAHQHGARFVLSANYPVNQLFNVTNRKIWIYEQIQQVKDLFADGINVDVESAITDPSQANLLTQLMKETNEAFKLALPFSQVTFDVAWSPDCIDLRCYDYVGLSKHTDFLIVMDYDLRSQIRGPCIASANSPLDLVKQGMINFTKLDIPTSKLVMGIPWYGYNYPCIDLSGNICSIKPVPFRGVNCSDAAGHEYAFETILDWLYQNSTGRQWNDELKSPFFNFLDDQDSQWHQVWYDDSESLGYKIEFAKQINLRGLAMWTADFLNVSKYPTQSNSIWNAMNGFFS